MASGGSRAADVQFALQRAKKKICELQLRLNEKPSEETSCWTPSKELRDSLVDMYKDNPGVNKELRQRLPVPQLCNATEPRGHSERSEIKDVFKEFPASCSSSPTHSPTPPSHSSPLLSFCRPPGGGAVMEEDSSPGREASPLQEGAAPSPAPRGHLGAVDSWSSAAHLNQSQNISMLLKQLDNLRLTNNQLQEQLVQKEKELRSREVQEELMEAQNEAQVWRSPTALLEEVLAAQKDRDQALMSRLLLANEERDEALLHVRHLQHAAEWDGRRPGDGDQDVDQLLHQICAADSAREIRRLGSSLVQRLRLARQRRDDITAQEMKAVMEERDATVAKVKQLEEFLQDGEQRQPCQVERLSLQSEGDESLEGRRPLEAELQARRSNQSLLDLTPSTLPDDSVSVATPLLVQLQQMSLEKQSLEAELRCSQEAELEAGASVRRLERLVEVLRKKVGSGPPRAVS